MKKKVTNKNWTYILRVGSFLSSCGIIAAGVLGVLPPPPPPLNYIVCIYLIILGAILLGTMIPWPKSWRLLTIKYVPFLHTYRGRGLYLIFIGTIAAATSSGVLGFLAVIIGIVVTVIGVLHVVIAFFFRDSLGAISEEMGKTDMKDANSGALKQELQQAAVQTAWENRDYIAKTAYDNREFVAQNADTIAHVAVNSQTQHSQY